MNDNNLFLVFIDDRTHELVTALIAFLRHIDSLSDEKHRVNDNFFTIFCYNSSIFWNSEGFFLKNNKMYFGSIALVVLLSLGAFVYFMGMIPDTKPYADKIYQEQMEKGTVNKVNRIRFIEESMQYIVDAVPYTTGSYVQTLDAEALSQNVKLMKIFAIFFQYYKDDPESKSLQQVAKYYEEYIEAMDYVSKNLHGSEHMDETKAAYLQAHWDKMIEPAKEMEFEVGKLQYDQAVEFRDAIFDAW